MNDVLQRAGGRKFVACLFGMLSASALAWFSKIDSGVYSAVMIALAGGYFASNVTQKAVTKGAP